MKRPAVARRRPIAVARVVDPDRGIDRDAVEDVTSAAEAIVATERDVARLIDDGRSLERAFEEAGMK